MDRAINPLDAGPLAEPSLLFEGRTAANIGDRSQLKAALAAAFLNHRPHHQSPQKLAFEKPHATFLGTQSTAFLRFRTTTTKDPLLPSRAARTLQAVFTASRTRAPRDRLRY